MKKIIVLFILLIITGCGSTEINDLDINKTSQIIENSLVNMENIEGEELENIYDLKLDSLLEYVVKQNNDGDMYAIIKTNNKMDVKEQMDNYFDKVRDFNTAYSPERVELIDDRLEKEIGNYLIYIVAVDSEKIYKDIVNSLE